MYRWLVLVVLSAALLVGCAGRARDAVPNNPTKQDPNPEKLSEPSEESEPEKAPIPKPDSEDEKSEANTAKGKEGDEKPKAKAVNEVRMFGGSPARNLANLIEKNLVDDFAPPVKDKASNPDAKAKNLKWTAALGGKAYGGPVIAGGRIFVGTNNNEPRDKAIDGDKGVVMCFRESDGAFLWQIVHDKVDENNDHPGEGVISVPCVDGEHVYYVSNRGEIICADVKGEKTKKGKIVWKYDMVKELDVFVGQASSSSPLIVGDFVYVLTGNGVNTQTGKIEKPNAPALVAVDKKTGKKAWTHDVPGEKVLRGQWSNPTAATIDGKTQIIYAGGDAWLYGLEAKSGALIWKFDCNPKQYGPYKYGGSAERAFIIATPVVHDNKCYVATGQEPDEGMGVGHLWCIDITKKPTNKDKDLSPGTKPGQKKEDLPVSILDPKDPANKDSGLVWHHGGKVEPAPKGDEREYHFTRTMGTVAIYDGVLYASELAGYIQALDAKTGKKLWEHDFTETIWGSPFAVDGKVYIGTDSNALYVFKASKEYNKPKRIRFAQSLKVPPVACNGVLYVNTGAYLYAFAPEKK